MEGGFPPNCRNSKVQGLAKYFANAHDLAAEVARFIEEAVCTGSAVYHHFDFKSQFGGNNLSLAKGFLVDASRRLLEDDDDRPRWAVGRDDEIARWWRSVQGSRKERSLARHTLSVTIRNINVTGGALSMAIGESNASSSLTNQSPSSSPVMNLQTHSRCPCFDARAGGKSSGQKRRRSPSPEDSFANRHEFWGGDSGSGNKYDAERRSEDRPPVSFRDWEHEPSRRDDARDSVQDWKGYEQRSRSRGAGYSSRRERDSWPEGGRR